MANKRHLDLINQGVDSWNRWRKEKRKTSRRPDLSGEDLTGVQLKGANLRRTDLSGTILRDSDLSFGDLTLAELNFADLHGANLRGAQLNGSNLRHANLTGATLADAKIGSDAFMGAANFDQAKLGGVDLHGMDLSRAYFHRAYLSGADLRGAKMPWTNLGWAFLRDAKLEGADLTGANFSAADLCNANLRGANLDLADLTTANLSYADLTRATLSRALLPGTIFVKTNLEGATVTDCWVYGISVWEVNLKGANQSNLNIDKSNPRHLPLRHPPITVDNLKVAQFVSLLLNNEEIRDVIDTTTSKAVLILGRFTSRRWRILDSIREELRRQDYLPILFDFEVPTYRDITETVSLLAGMARFVVADLTDPSSIPKELEAIVPHLAVPVQPLIEGSDRPYAMFKDSLKYDWVLPLYRYEGLEQLLATINEKVISPAEEKVKTLLERRRMIEAELTKPTTAAEASARFLGREDDAR